MKTIKKNNPVMRIRIRMGKYELEVNGPKDWAEKAIDEFIAKRRKEAQP